MQFRSSAEKAVLFSTVRLAYKIGLRPAYGTGFLIELPHGSGHAIVSNRHILKAGGLTEISADFRVGTFNSPIAFTIKLNPNNVLVHPDPFIDLALIPINDILSEHPDILFSPLSTKDIPRDWNTLYATEFLISAGYPNGLMDGKTATPVIRHGASSTPISLDFGDSPCFLADIAVFGGASGSPVFLSHLQNPTSSMGVYLDKLVLLGIQSSAMTMPINASFRNTWTTIDTPIHLAKIIKSSELLRLPLLSDTRF